MSEQNRTDPMHRLNRIVDRQRFYMSFEALWAAWSRPFMVLGGGGIIVVSGILSACPVWLRVAVLAAFLLLLFWSIGPLWRMPRIKRTQVLRALEISEQVKHRGISSAEDPLAVELGNPQADALWIAHKQQQLAKLDGIKAVPPRSRWRQFDPYALRVPVALGLFAAVVLGTGTFTQNLREATRVTAPAKAVPLTTDAWLKPPPYTGRPPLLITSPAMQEKLAAGAPLEVPENSVFSLRVSGAANPSLVLLTLDGAQPVSEIQVKASTKEGALTAEATLSRPVAIVVRDGSRELARWPISLLPDAPPTLKLTEKPEGDRKGNLTLKWAAQDDYGVRQILGELELADEQDGQTGFESNGIFLFDAPELKFVLRRANARDEKGTSRFDLAKHPWAGFNVTLGMTAKDAANQEGTLEPVTFKMPERVFSRPLPRALIEQRKQLVLYPERAGHVGKLIDTLNLYPKGLFEGRAPSMMLGAIASRLRNAAGYPDVHLAMDMMWDLAVKLEDGSLSDLRAELKALKEELEKALREGAPQERIAELMDKMRDAMNKYMDAMRDESERMQAEGQQPQQPDGNSKSITREDLERMMKELEDMSKSGNNDMAQQLLDQLDQLLQNMQPGGQQQAGEGEGSMEDMMQGLGDMMRKQQRLMDETQRMGQGQQPGENGEQGDGQQPGEGQGKGLAGKQQQLREQLDGLRGQGGGNPALDDAERAMGEAEQSLRDGDREGALQKQGEALQNLRKGAQELAQQMRERGQGQQNGEARDGDGRGGQDDPLGRPRATRQPDTGPQDDILPTERSREKAREILETLRKKANEQGLSDQERSYIDRLMRGLY